MKKSCKMLSLLLAAAMMGGTLTACGGSSSSTASSAAADVDTGTAIAENDSGGNATNENASGEAVQRDVVNVGISADPGDLSPWGPENTGRTAMANQIYQSLAHEIDGEIVGVLMSGFDLAEDESYADCHLYDYIVDAAGNPLTASDVVFSFDQCRAAGNVNGLGFVESAEVIDDYTVRFNFNTTLYVYDLETLFTTMYIVTQAAYEASPDGMATDPVTTAHYQVTDYTAGYIITCEKNENYWQTDESLISPRDAANVDTINYYILTESTQMSTALQTGDIDMSWSVNTEDMQSFVESDDYWLYQAPDNLVNEIFLNCDPDHATADVNLRKAIYYSINNEALLQGIYTGNGILCYDTAAPKAPDWQDAWATEDNYYHYNLETAQEYLDAWGGDPASLNLVILVSNEAAVSNMAQMVQGFMGQLGINSTILSVDSATLTTYTSDPTQWDVLIQSKATGNYVVTSWKNCFSQSYFTWGGSINFIYDDTLEELLSTARLQASHNEETVKAVHDYIIDNAYGYGAIDTVDNYVVTSGCSEVVTSYKGAILPGGCTYVA